MILRENNDVDLDDEQIWESVLDVYNKHGHILFLIDSSLDEFFLNDFLKTLNDDELYY